MTKIYAKLLMMICILFSWSVLNAVSIKGIRARYAKYLKLEGEQRATHLVKLLEKITDEESLPFEKRQDIFIDVSDSAVETIDELIRATSDEETIAKYSALMQLIDELEQRFVASDLDDEAQTSGADKQTAGSSRWGKVKHVLKRYAQVQLAIMIVGGIFLAANAAAGGARRSHRRYPRRRY